MIKGEEGEEMRINNKRKKWGRTKLGKERHGKTEMTRRQSAYPSYLNTAPVFSWGWSAFSSARPQHPRSTTSASGSTVSTEDEARTN